MNDNAASNDPTEAPDGVEVVEVITEEVDSEGNLIVDDSVFVLDAAGEVVASSETITFETPEGEVMVSVLGDDGEMHLVDDELSDDADGADGADGSAS